MISSRQQHNTVMDAIGRPRPYSRPMSVARMPSMPGVRIPSPAVTYTSVAGVVATIDYTAVHSCRRTERSR